VDNAQAVESLLEEVDRMQLAEDDGILQEVVDDDLQEDIHSQAHSLAVGNGALMQNLGDMPQSLLEEEEVRLAVPIDAMGEVVASLVCILERDVRAVVVDTETTDLAEVDNAAVGDLVFDSSPDLREAEDDTAVLVGDENALVVRCVLL
jgi:hypothetical protein